MEAANFRAALKAAGLKVTNRVFLMLVVRYSNDEGKINFGDFIQCSVRLAYMLGLFLLILDFLFFFLISPFKYVS